VSHTGVSVLWFIDYLRRFSKQLRLIIVLSTLLVLWNLLDLLDYDTVRPIHHHTVFVHIMQADGRFWTLTSTRHPKPVLLTHYRRLCYVRR